MRASEAAHLRSLSKHSSPITALASSKTTSLRPDGSSRPATTTSTRSAIVVPAVREPHEPQLARVAGDDEGTLHVIEETHALGVHRMGTEHVFPGQQREV